MHFQATHIRFARLLPAARAVAVALAFTAAATSAELPGERGYAIPATALFHLPAGELSAVIALVRSGDRGPKAKDDRATTPEDTPVRIDVLANDDGSRGHDHDDDDELRLTAVTDGHDGDVAINPDGTVTYSPNPDFNGTDSFSYTVQNDDGNDTGEVRVDVTPVNDSPETGIDAPAGDVTVQVGEAVTFSGSAADPDGAIRSYSWDFGGGAPPSSVEDPGLVTFEAAGLFTVVFNARDDFGAMDPRPDSRAVHVVDRGPPPPPANSAPEAVIDAPAGTVTIGPGQSVMFAGTGRDRDGRIVAYRWSFGSGAADRTVEDPGAVAFTVPGTFIVTFNVTDDRGAADPTPPAVVVLVAATSGGSGDGSDGGADPPAWNVDVSAPGSAERVDGHDLIYVLRAIATQEPRADVNRDGSVDVADVREVAAAMGRVP